MGMHRFLSMMAVLAGVLALSACEASTPTHLTAEKMRVEERMVARTVDTDRVRIEHVSKIADDFLHSGKGDMVLTMSYQKDDKAGRARIERLSADYKKAFSRAGVAHLSVVPVPVDSREDANKAVVTYNALAALPARSCDSAIPGQNGATATISDIDDYRFGCQMQTVMGKMIADPSDLLGKPGTQNGDSRRNSTMTDPYKAGTPNQPLGGYSVSGIGG